MRTFIFILLILVCLACDKNALFDSGPTVTKTIQLIDSFSLIEAENIFDITLVQDTAYKILVTCGENLQKYVDIKITNYVLHLNHHTKYDWSRSYEKIKLELHLVQMPQMNIREPIRLTSSGTLTIPSFNVVDCGKFSEINVTLNVGYCQIGMSSDNFGYFKVRGKCKTANLWGWGSATVRADSLTAGTCTVRNRGWGDVYVNFISKLEVTIENTGNIYYKGNSDNILIDKQIGGGQLIALP